MKKSYFGQKDMSAKDYAFRLLSRRNYAKAELKQKLENKGFGPKQIAETLKRLEELKFVDDKEFAYGYAVTRLNKSPRAKRILFRELSRKGVPEEIIESIVPEVYKEYKEDAMLSGIINKEVKVKKTYKAIKDKLVRKLFRLGFAEEDISRAIEKYENS